MPDPIKDDTLADIIQRVKATGLTDKIVHERADLPAGWLSQLRAGRYKRSAASVKKLLRWLVRVEAAAKDVVEAAVSPTGETLGQQIARDILTARKSAEVADLERRIAAGVIGDQLDEAKAELSLNALRGLKASIKLVREDDQHQALRALEVLTPGELRVLEEYRARVVGPPLAPGAYVGPPEVKA